jgi:CheY-like chemotaxis protein
MARESEQPPRILIVEDDVVVALHEEDLVRSLGCEIVGPVGRIDDALRVVQTAGIEGAVLDIHLNGNATSYPVAAELENRGIPFIFVTGLDKAGLAKLFPAA